MHLTNDQLNEYLDNETIERAQIEAHISSCDECAARYAALKTLFTEIESLPELELTHSLAARFVSTKLNPSTPTPSLPPQLPRWLTLTATLQAALALIAIIFAAPFITNLLPAISTPSFTDIFISLQAQWSAWLDLLSSFQLPPLPQIPALEISSLMLAVSLVSVFVLWVLGNGLLLRKQVK